MKVLIGCEESQTICQAFRDLGHEAYSCDIRPTRGKHPEWHIQGDVLELLGLIPTTKFWNSYPYGHNPRSWVLGIFHPTCKCLCNSGVRWLTDPDGTRNEPRWKEMIEAATFFKKLLYCQIPRVVIENPVMHQYAREEVGVNWGQLIQPYEFGNPNTKATGLWLKNVPALKLDPEKLVPKEKRIDTIHRMAPSETRSRDRAVTFPEIATAMAEQWGCLE